MTQYRKKSVVVDAFQMTKERRWNNKDWPDWLHKAWNREPGENAIWIDPAPATTSEYELADMLVCGTFENMHKISYGDYIIQGINEEIYPCNPNIFEKTHE